MNCLEHYKAIIIITSVGHDSLNNQEYVAQIHGAHIDMLD
jgi:hypothetical protein